MSSNMYRTFNDFFTIGPHAGAHRVALRAAACLAIPLLILYIIDRTDLALYASFGAFAAVYGRNDSYAQRLSMQASAGFTIVAAMLIGTLLSYWNTPNALRVFVIAILAAVVTLVAFRLSWKPTGAMFAVFSSGACASIAATGMSFVHVIVVGGGTVLISLIVTASLSMLRVRPRELVHLPMVAPLLTKHVANAIMILVASALAGWAGLILFGDHWYWAMIAAIAVLVGANIHARLTRGLQRFLGTAVGVFLAAAVLWIDPPIIIVFGIAIFCQGFIELIILRNHAAGMIFITVIALVMVNMASPLSSDILIRNRVLETLLGVVIGMTVTVAAQMLDIE